MLKLGKLYYLKEDVSLLYPSSWAAYYIKDHYKGVFIDTNQPFLILDFWTDSIGRTKYFEVLLNDRKGWTCLDLNNVEEVK